MNVSDSDRTPPHAADDGFDTRARQAHAASLDALSPRVRAQLQQRRRAAIAGEGSRRGVRWAPTLAVAATLVLAATFGLRLLWPSAQEADRDVVLAERTTPSGIDAGDGAESDTASAQGGTNAAQTRIADAVDRTDIETGVETGVETNLGQTGLGTTRGAAVADANAEREVDAILAMFEHADATAAPEDIAVAGDDALLASLEESPDFYLWLSADDGADVEAL